MKKSLLILVFLFSLSLQSQNLIFVGNNSYKATKPWFFKGNGDQFKYYANDATIQVGRKGQSYILSISTKVYNASFGIKGTVRVYLDDGSTIVLSKTFSKDYSDQYSTVIFQFSMSDISKLKKSDINTIRFNSGLSGQLEGTTASNRWFEIIDPYSPNVVREINWTTANDISQL
jgi:hypothetical protein